MTLITGITSGAIRATFDAPEPLTVGLEEEVLLLDPDTLDLAPRGEAVLDRLEGDPRFKPELPAAQLEIVTEPTTSVADAVAALAAGRQDLARAAEGIARPAVGGAHPFATGEGELNTDERYAHIRDEYGRVASRQLVSSLQVHVAVGDADRALAVYNALRSHLPELAALAANAPYYEGVDTGLASVRPKICDLLPRQGVPPAIASWDELAAELRWGASAGSVGEPRLWWWELRPHLVYGTLELRVPDAQTTVADAAGIAALAHALVARLGERHEAGERLPVAPTWRIEENRWSACRHGVEGEMADPETGEREPTRARIERLIGEVEPTAERLGSAALLAHARRLAESPAAARQREAALRDGPRGVAARLADEFLSGTAGAQPVAAAEGDG